MIPQFSIIEDGFELHVAGRLMLRHSRSCPTLTVARGQADVTMVRGNFRITDTPSGQITPIVALVEPDRVELLADGKPCALLSIEADGALLVETADPAYDRLWLRFHAEPQEAVWGGGEQMSYLALNGRAFPMDRRSAHVLAASSRSGPASRASAATSRPRSPVAWTRMAWPAAITGTATIRSRPS